MLLAVEGIDGSGKNTQSQLLVKRAIAEGFRTQFFTFPAYSTNIFGALVGDYLNGEFGSVNQVSPKLSAILYAGDRFESKVLVEKALINNDLVVCDRYVPSNLAHQSAKVPRKDRRDFIQWLSRIEYDIFEVPKPDLVVFLSIPTEISAELVAQKSERDYTNKKADIHESDRRYLDSCRESYNIVSEMSSEPWFTVNSTMDNLCLKAPNDINEEIWAAVRNQLDHTIS